MSTFFQNLAFWRENDVIHLAPKIVLSIMVYSMTVSERTCREDLRTEKLTKICRTNQKLWCSEFLVCSIFSNKMAENSKFNVL